MPNQIFVESLVNIGQDRDYQKTPADPTAVFFNTNICSATLSTEDRLTAANLGFLRESLISRRAGQIAVIPDHPGFQRHDPRKRNASNSGGTKSENLP
jgi:hypothetical protein